MMNPFPLTDFPVLPLALSDSLRSSLMLIGTATFAGGILLMFWHKRQVDEVNRTEKDPRNRSFEQRKFRRRSTVSTMISAMGILIVSLNWAREPEAFTVLVSLILILLLAVMFLAVLDMMSISIHMAANPNDKARQKMIQDYLRQREKLLGKVDDADNSE